MIFSQKQTEYQRVPSEYSKVEIFQMIQKAESGSSFSSLQKVYREKTGNYRLDQLVKVYLEGRRKTNPRSIRTLGIYLIEGKKPFIKDKKRGMRYLKMAADKGDKKAKKILINQIEPRNKYDAARNFRWL